MPFRCKKNISVQIKIDLNRVKWSLFPVVFSLSNDHIANIPDETESILDEPCHINDIDVEILRDENEEDKEGDMTRITTEQYKDLIQLSIKCEKLQQSINRMEKVIKSKDSKIKELKTILENGNWVDLSKLLKVSTFYIVLHRFTRFYIKKSVDSSSNCTITLLLLTTPKAAEIDPIWSDMIIIGVIQYGNLF